MPTFLFAALLAAAPVASQQPERPPPRDRSTERGVAISACTGHGCGAILGAQVLYFHPFAQLASAPLTASLSLGAGYLPGLGATSTVGAAGGVAVSWGWRHRLLAGLDYGTLVSSPIWLHGTKVGQVTIWGPTAAGGYEYVSASGLLLRVLLGAGFLMDRRIDPQQRVPFLSSSLSLGWKL